MRQLSIHPSLKGKLPDIIDIVDQLPRIKTWEELSKPYRHKGHWDGVTYHTGFRKPEDINTIVVHHSGSPEGSMEDHARFHSRKWGASVAYHLMIDKGRIWQTNNLLSFTYHVGNHNTYTVGIEVNADLSKREMTSQERELLYGAIMSVKAVLPIEHILGHNELNPTQCPATSMNQIRADIMAIEQKMIFEQSAAHSKETAYKIANQIMYVYRMADGKLPDGKPATEGQVKWATDMLLKMYPFMQENKLMG